MTYADEVQALSNAVLVLYRVRDYAGIRALLDAQTNPRVVTQAVARLSVDDVLRGWLANAWA